MTSTLSILEFYSDGSSVDEEWAIFKDKNGRIFTSSLEENKRFAIFNENLQLIKEHNIGYEQGQVSYKLGINKFADLTEEEFAERRLIQNELSKYKTMPIAFDYQSASKVPDTFDWRSKGAVTPVQDQGDCGSCYIFSAIGTLEAQYFLKNKKLVEFSEQYILDCDPGWNYGCEGGWSSNVFHFIRNSGVLETSQYNNYSGAVSNCTVTANTTLKNIGFGKVPKDEEQLKVATATIGPLAISINAIGMSMYEGGVYDNPKCRNTTSNHEVVIAGYGTSDGKDYWLVKNSWGPDWGEKGYIRMSRNKNNQCGVMNEASYPIL